MEDARLGDSSPEILAMQTTILRKLSGAQRLAIAIHMSQTVREFSLARIRQRHPEWSDLELKRELLRYAFPPNDLPPPLR